MIDYQPLFQQLDALQAEQWLRVLPAQLEQAFDLKKHGSAADWFEIIQQLPAIQPHCVDLNRGAIKIGNGSELDDNARRALIKQLKIFHPWRKGPYQLFAIDIDTEWRSDWKWERLQNDIEPLQGRHVLDVGCGNGYHCWRMLGAGAKLVVGVDPLLLNVLQFQIMKHFLPATPVHVLPVGLEQLPPALKLFDTVFSMGVLYHRRSPIDHLLELKDCLRPGGQLVLETLVIEGKDGEVLMPEGRYAKMRNVWFLPSCDTLLGWLKRCGFKNCRLIDVSVTTTEEQRSTDWMQFHSLKQFLNADNADLTCEGLPAPRRAIISADAP